MLLAALFELMAAISAHADGAGVKRALLVGINRYRAVPSLQGSVNDVETMRQILTTRWGFAPQYIQVLTDEAASRAAIVAALERLVRESNPDDFVYFHFSGHGSQVEDLDGDQPDGLDETLVPQDGRSGDVRDIAHDDLVDVFGRLRARRAVLVLDSCHSGTGLRSLDVRTRSVPQDLRIELYRAAMNAVKTRAIVPVPSSRYVVLAAAAANEEALDGPIDGQYHGYFTHALAKSLSASPAGASAKAVFAGVARELNRIQAQLGRNSMPEPQLEGPALLFDAPLIELPQAATPAPSGPARPRLPWLPVRLADNGQLLLQNGRLLGAVPGSEWAIYPPGENQFLPGHALAVASVIRLQGQDSLARLRTPARTITPDSRAVSLLPPGAGESVAIRILEASPERRKQIEAALARDITKVTFVGPGQPANYLIDATADSVRLLTGDGLQVAGSFGTDAAQWESGIAHIVARTSSVAQLLTLDNPSSQLALSVRVANSQPLATRGIAIVADTQATHYRIRRAGAARSPQNSLQLELSVSADAYVTIVDVDAEGRVNLLFPNDVQRREFLPEGLVRARQSEKIPDSLQPDNRAGFYWDYTPPEGEDVVRVFASTDRATTDLIRARIRAMQASGLAAAGAGSRSVADDVAALREDVSELATRGIRVVADSGSQVSVAPDWTASSVTMRITQ